LNQGDTTGWSYAVMYRLLLELPQSLLARISAGVAIREHMGMLSTNGLPVGDWTLP